MRPCPYINNYLTIFPSHYVFQILDAIPKDTKGRVLLHFHLNNKDTKVMNGKKELTAIVIQVLASQELSIQHPTIKGQRLEGSAAVVLCQAFGAALSPAEVFAVPDANTFTSSEGHSGVGAYVKASGGFLFPVPAGLCFLETPASFLPLASISSVELARANGASSTFDLYVHCKDGSTKEFSQISRSEVPAIENYIRATKLDVGAPVESDDEDHNANSGAQGGDANGSDSDSDDLDDEDFNPEESSDEEGGGPKKKRRKIGGGGIKDGGEEGGSKASKGGEKTGDVATVAVADDEEAEEGDYESDDDDSDNSDSDSDDGSVEMVSEDEFSMGQFRGMVEEGKKKK